MGPGTQSAGEQAIHGPLCGTVVFYPGLWKLLWSSAPHCSSLGTDSILSSL